MILCLLPLAIIALPFKHIFPVEGESFMEILDQPMKIDNNDVFDVELGFASETQKSNLSTSLFQNIADLNIIDFRPTNISIPYFIVKGGYIFAEKHSTYQYGLSLINETGAIALWLQDSEISSKTNNCSGFTLYLRGDFQFICANYTTQRINLYTSLYTTILGSDIDIPIEQTTQIYFYEIRYYEYQKEPFERTDLIIFTFDNNQLSQWKLSYYNRQLFKMGDLTTKIFQFENNIPAGVQMTLTDDQFICSGKVFIQIFGQYEQFTSSMDIKNKSFRIAIVSRDQVTFVYIDMKQDEKPYIRDDKLFPRNQITSSNSQIFLNNDYLIFTNDVAVYVYEYKDDIKLKYQIPTQQKNKALFIDEQDLIILVNNDGTVQNIQIGKDILLYSYKFGEDLNGSFQLSATDSQNQKTTDYQFTTLKKNDFSIQTLQNQFFTETNTYPFIMIRENDIFYGPNITINGLQNIPETHKDITRQKVTRTPQNVTLINQFITFDKDLQQYLAVTIQDSQIYFSLMKLDLMDNTFKITNITQFSQTKDVQDIKFLKQSDGQYLVFATSSSEIQYYKIFTNELEFNRSQSLKTINTYYEGLIRKLQLAVSTVSLKVLVNNEIIGILYLEQNDTYSYGSYIKLPFDNIVSDPNYDDVLYITGDSKLFQIDISDDDGNELINGRELDISHIMSTQIGFMKEGIFVFQQSKEEQYLSFILKQSLKRVQIGQTPNSQVAQAFSSSSIYTYTEKFFYNIQKVQGNQELVIYQVQPSSFNMIYQSIYFKQTIKQISCSTNSFEQYDLCIVVFDTGLSEQVIIMHEYIIVLLNTQLFNQQQSTQTLLRNQTYQQCETPQSIYNASYSELTIICSNNSYVYDLKTQTDTDLNETNAFQQITLSASNQNGTVNSSIQLNFVSLSDKATTSSALTIIIILLLSVIVVIAGTILFYMRRKSLLLKQNNVLPEENPKTDRYSESRV